MNRTALITGATRGIGQAVARQLAALGFRLFLTGRDAGRLAAVKDEVRCEGAVAELSDASAVRALYGRAREVLGDIEVLVNNAGFNRAKVPITAITEEDLDDSYAVNVRAPILLAREALKDMGGRRCGHIVNVISSIVRVGMENYSIYTAMKHALHGFNTCLVKEARAVGVKVTAVYPGGTDTDFRANRRPDYLRAGSAARVIVQCLTAPEDVVVHEIVYRPMVETNF